MAISLDALLADEKPDVVRRAQIKVDRILLGIRLSEVRALLQNTQKDLAQAMGVTQPTIADMKNAGKDLKLSSIKRYVESAGAKVHFDHLGQRQCLKPAVPSQACGPAPA